MCVGESMHVNDVPLIDKTVKKQWVLGAVKMTLKSL